MLLTLDLLLVLGLTLRLFRFLAVDSLTGPLRERIEEWGAVTDRRWFYVSAMTSCPFCLGFWVGVAVLASLYLVGGPGEADMLWRYAAGAFTLNYVAGHINVRLDSDD